jgi:CO dehydrogenase maturation factor
MTRVLAVAGKGGVGKTTFSTFLILALARKGSIVLAVDADPNTNLDEKLGVKLEGTIGQLREEISKNVENLPAGISKPEYIQIKLQEALTEGPGFDLVALGRQEGPGCYCYINQLLRTTLDSLSEKYRNVVIDNEAGMEHLSRRTTRKVDLLFIVADPTMMGIKTATRIKELARRMDIKVGKCILVVNRTDGLPDNLKKIIDEAGFDHLELIPDDPDVRKASEMGEPLSNVPASSTARKKVEAVLASLS